MPAAAVHAAFQARLVAQWDESDAVIIEGNTVTVPPDEPHVLIQYPVANGEKPSLGRRFFEEGAARIVLNIPVGTGLSAGLAMADTLAGIFREVRFDGIQTFASSGPLVNDISDEGNWFELTCDRSVSIPVRRLMR